MVEHLHGNEHFSHINLYYCFFFFFFFFNYCLFVCIQGYMYYINDGVYGSFNCLVFDHATVVPETVKGKPW